MAARSAAAKGRGPRATRAARDIKPHAGKAAALLKALANEQRLMIVCNLVAGPLSVGELNAKVALSQSALSQHLAVLRDSNVVVTEREAQSIRCLLAWSRASSRFSTRSSAAADRFVSPRADGTVFPARVEAVRPIDPTFAARPT